MRVYFPHLAALKKAEVLKSRRQRRVHPFFSAFRGRGSPGSLVTANVMVSALITIINKLGLHARAAAKLVQLSNQFSSNINLVKDGEDANAKSIMDVLMLAGAMGTQLRIVAEGPDEREALEEISALINNRFEEEE